MALNVGRWWKYAQAKVNDVVSTSHRELDDLEAERELEVADKPWLSSDRESPTLDETRARIEAATEAAAAGSEASAPEGDAPIPSGAPTTLPSDPSEAAEVAAAHLELDRQARESAARLDAIREELGVDRPVDPPSDGSA